ncbi:MAG: ABC transporter ATP-binding protein [Planctomycetota bacterium]|nr:ABC transporter ATP-binding protein [Planctomycetota bacterium]
MIELVDVGRRFGARQALSSVSLTMKPGGIYGICGRNGAGKTTLIRLLAGTLAPSEGRVLVLGKPPTTEWHVRRDMGIVEDGDGFFPELTVREYLWWVGRLRGLGEPACDNEIAAIMPEFYLEDRAEDLIGSLSHGMRRKALLAGAFIAGPRVILLDEPTTGLDTDSLDSLAALLERRCQEGAIAIVCTHDRAFVERVCSYLIELDDGQVVAHRDLRDKTIT